MIDPWFVIFWLKNNYKEFFGVIWSYLLYRIRKKDRPWPKSTKLKVYWVNFTHQNWVGVSPESNYKCTNTCALDLLATFWSANFIFCRNLFAYITPLGSPFFFKIFLNFLEIKLFILYMFSNQTINLTIQSNRLVSYWIK